MANSIYFNIRRTDQRWDQVIVWQDTSLESLHSVSSPKQVIMPSLPILKKFDILGIIS